MQLVQPPRSRTYVVPHLGTEGLSPWYITIWTVWAFQRNLQPCSAGRQRRDKSFPCLERRTHLHMLSSCRALKQIWQNVASKVTEIKGILTTLTHQMCLFFAEIPGTPPPNKNCPILYLVWSTGLLPCSGVLLGYLWDRALERMVAMQLMEKVFHTIMDTMPIYDRKWKPWPSWTQGVYIFSPIENDPDYSAF